MNELQNKSFSPLTLLAVIGAGGISIIPFAYYNYTVEHPKGLITFSQLIEKSLFDYGLMFLMTIFAILHFILFAIFIKDFYRFIKSGDFKSFFANPITNNTVLTIFIALAMSMNVLIGPIRFFIPSLSENLQALMMPALLFWIMLSGIFLFTYMKIQKSLFVSRVDLSKIGFGWLLDVFALSMLAVTGSGIAALSKDVTVAHTAAFISLMFATMAIFFLVIKITLVFQKYLSDAGLPEKQYLPSFLNIVPAITLLSITFFRLGHYIENNFDFHIDHFFTIIITTAFALETWYLIFGATVIFEYFKKHHFTKDYYPSQWALICPFVAYAVLGSFTYNVFVQAGVIKIMILISMVTAIGLFITIFYKFLFCKLGTTSECIE